jgi:hypothetical protein
MIGGGGRDLGAAIWGPERFGGGAVVWGRWLGAGGKASHIGQYTYHSGKIRGRATVHALPEVHGLWGHVDGEFVLVCTVDIPAEKLLSDKYPVQPEPALKSGVEPDCFNSLAVMAEEAPNRPPGRLNFGRIESLLAARTSAAEDQYELPFYAPMLN